MTSHNNDTTRNGATLQQQDASTVDDNVEHIFELLVSRSRGQVNTDQVENAVSQLLAKSAPKQPQLQEDVIQQDTDDYDNLDDAPPLTAVKKRPPPTLEQQEATLESMRNDYESSNDEQDDDALDSIPLGKAGARMMVTFGDGHSPKPRAVQAALLGARRCLQMAIKDARALRRQQQEEYQRARKIALLSSKQGKLKGGAKLEHNEPSAGADMMYRAMQGWDKLAFDPKCGFDVEQLRQLFPEEMRAYSRWSEMHNSYKQSSEETGVDETLPKKTNDEDAESDEKPIDTDISVAEGHLEERAAQFDVRTDQMENDWYLKFSEVRRGSFLPKKSGMKKAEEREWDAKRKSSKTKGRTKAGNWETMSATSVRFLHWVGFDPRSALPPPNDEVTEALAFLAYDFMGRIVEKAIYLRNVANQKDDKNLLLELQDGEQLEEEDIEKALNDSTIRPVPLYSSLEHEESSSMPVAASLYFGPGFEDRLEMEMEELASGKKRKRLSPEELAIRQSEDALFSKLANTPPSFDGFADILSEEPATKKETATNGSAAKGRTNGKKTKKKK